MSRTKRVEVDPFAEELCPVCGSEVSDCLGHGGAGDPVGRMILQRHDSGDHADCQPGVCET